LAQEDTEEEQVEVVKASCDHDTTTTAEATTTATETTISQERQDSRCKRKSKKKTNRAPVVTTRTYNILLDAWSTSRQPGAAERCLEILNEMDQLVALCGSKNSEKDHLRPDTTTFNACIKALVHGAGYQQESREGQQQQQQQQHELASFQRSKRQPQQRESVVDRVQELIDEMKRRQKEQESFAEGDYLGNTETAGGTTRRMIVRVAPDRRTYNLFLYAMANCPQSFVNPNNGTATVNRAMVILREMWNQYHVYKQQDDETSELSSAAAASTSASSSPAMWIKPNTNTYNQVITCVARGQESGRFEDQLQELLDEMISLSSSSSTSSPSLSARTQADEHTSDNHKDSSSSSLSSSDFSTSVAPNTDSYNGVMGGWLKSRQPPSLSLERVLTIWNRMQHEYHENGNESARPDRVTLNILLTAHTKFGTASKATKNAATAASLLHSRTATTLDNENVNVNNECALEKTLTLWHSFQKAYDILPDIVSFNVLLNSWSKSQRYDAPSQTLQILTFLERSLLDNKDDPICPAGVGSSLATLEANKTKKKKLDIPKPNSYSYATHMDCLVRHEWQQRQQHYRAGDEEAEFQVAEQVEAVLRRMQALHRDHGGEAPNASVYNTVINAWATCALSVPASSRTSSHAVKQAEALLREMETEPLAPKPNRVTYNTVLKTKKTGRTQDAARAEELLLLLEQQTANDDRNTDVGTDSYSYTSVISAYSRSHEANKVDKVFELLLRLLDSFKRKSLADRRLSIHASNAALNACAHGAEGKTEKEKILIFSKATAITSLIEEYDLFPDDTTYGTMLRAASTLLPNGRRQEIIDSLFRRACEAGVCGPMVLKQLKFSTKSPELYALMLGLDSWVPPRGDVTVKDVPRRWSRNLLNGTGNRRQR
jgi:hypothetical protein